MRPSARRDVVILVCTISAGAHAALAPRHFEEHPAAGVGYVAAAAVLALVVVALTRRRTLRVGLVGSAFVLPGLVTTYWLAVTTGVPVLQPGSQSVDAVGLAVKVVEAAGFVAASTLLRRPSPVGARPVPLFLAVLVASFAALVTLVVSDGHDHLAPHDAAAPPRS